jgi:hypothetical protein
VQRTDEQFCSWVANVPANAGWDGGGGGWRVAKTLPRLYSSDVRESRSGVVVCAVRERAVGPDPDGFILKLGVICAEGTPG